MPPTSTLFESRADDAIANSTRRRDKDRGTGSDISGKEDDRSANKPPRTRRVHRSSGARSTASSTASASNRMSSRSKANAIASSRYSSANEVPAEGGKGVNEAPGQTGKGNGSGTGGRMRHRRTLSNRSMSSSNSSTSDEDERGDDDGKSGGSHEAQDHRAVLAAARGRLTSPSLLSTLTTLTTATNNSGGSSSSNSTVTQASMTRRRVAESMVDVPVSPAVPDPPNVFAFLEKDDSDSDDEEQDYVPPNWPRPEPESDRPSTPEHLLVSRQRSTSSSASSSFHSDSSTFDPTAADADQDHDSATDRSTSPERSVKSGGDDEPRSPTKRRSNEASTTGLNPDPTVPTSPAAAKFAAQMLAAHHRQSLHSNIHHSHQGHPAYTYPSYPAPYAPPPQQLAYAIQSPPSAQFQHFTFPSGAGAGSGSQVSQVTSPGHLHQRRASASSSVVKSKCKENANENQADKQKRQVSGYEALASALSRNALQNEVKIQPIYRKFGALNHRLLLHLQDEISELEEALAILDSADNTSRLLTPNQSQNGSQSSDSTDSDADHNSARALQRVATLPASRRAPKDPALSHHRSELLARISYKLAQYNSTLTSFNTLSSSLPVAQSRDIQSYRTFLQKETPIVDTESRFLEREDDLVSVGSDVASVRSRSVKKVHFQTSHAPSGSVTAVAVAAAAAVLLPILTFAVIPGFVGRMAVVWLVAAGVVGGLIQSGVVGMGRLMGSEGCVCASIYAGLMVVVAGIIG